MLALPSVLLWHSLNSGRADRAIFGRNPAGKMEQAAKSTPGEIFVAPCWLAAAIGRSQEGVRGDVSLVAGQHLAIMASTSNGTQKRYDRQIRLWGAHGQTRLEASKICVLGAGPMCTEALKNLVLGGIASFTIVDSKNVSEEDLRNNFFLQRSSLGSGRAQAACTLLRDLNDQVKGSFSDADVTDMLESSPDVLNEYNLVIAEQV